MCRFIAYLGQPLVIDELLFKPVNSLIKQSIKARETDEPLNGDGFGLGWYNHDIGLTPALFTSTQPAWNDRNLQYLAASIRTDCLFAHVRAASMGGVGIYNCHPFQYKHLLFMHNGEIGDFSMIKRHLRRELDDEIYDWIKGQTDSEHFFALFLQTYQDLGANPDISVVGDVLVATIKRLEALQALHRVTAPNYLNLAITDGSALLALRYVSDPNLSCPTLYYSAGSHYEFKEGGCHMISTDENEGNGAVLLVSEKLTNYRAEWAEIPVNHMLLVRHDLSLKLRAV